MPRLPQSHNKTTPLEKFDNTAYDAVELVAQNIEDVIRVADGVDVMALYLGASDTEPTTGIDGEPLVSGNFYLDTTTSSLKYWDGENGVWVESDVDTVVNAAREAQEARDAAVLAQAAAEAAESNSATSASNSSASASAAATSASNASTSEGIASSAAITATSARNDAQGFSQDAATSASDASASETNASDSAAASSASEINAASSAVNAAQSANEAQLAFDNFDDKYLGSKTVPPTTDNDGQPLEVGASYWHDNGDNTGELNFWNGATWESPDETASQSAQIAVQARDDAEAAEANAALSESAAMASANAAGVDANNAGNSATDAANSASTASTKAQEALDSEQAANASEQNAANSAAAASDSADAAAVSEANAAASASIFEWQRYVRDKAALDTLREQHNSVRAASGFDHYGKHFNFGTVNEGMWKDNGTESNMLWMGFEGALGTSQTHFPVTAIAGFISNLRRVNEDNERIRVKFSEAPDGTVTYNSATGDVVQHGDSTTAFAYADANADTEVVIERHDMFGGEFFLEEVSVVNPFVYPNGMIQSKAASMNGITTVVSARPDTYYAVFDGDTGSKGLGVDFWAATIQQKIDMVSDTTNNLFLLDDGRLVQWRMRQRTIAGIGNGDWYRVSPVGYDALGFAAGRYTTAQGIGNAPATGQTDEVIFLTSGHPNGHGEQGVFSTGAGSTLAVDGECYFHVWGVVPRLNFGLYHPSLNALGCAADINGKKWYDTTLAFNSTADCFDTTKVSHD